MNYDDSIGVQAWHIMSCFVGSVFHLIWMTGMDFLEMIPRAQLINRMAGVWDGHFELDSFHNNYRDYLV